MYWMLHNLTWRINVTFLVCVPCYDNTTLEIFLDGVTTKAVNIKHKEENIYTHSW